jgi:hypothetical protein
VVVVDHSLRTIQLGRPSIYKRLASKRSKTVAFGDDAAFSSLDFQLYALYAERRASP